MNGDGGAFYGLRLQKPNKASKRIAKMFDEVDKNGYTRDEPFSIGKVDAAVRRFAASRGIPLGDGDIYISPKFIAHALRESKGDKRVARSQIINFPTTKRYMHVYYDGEAFIYTDYNIKFIIKPNYRVKTHSGPKRVTNMITAGAVTSREEFELKKYERIK